MIEIKSFKVKLSITNTLAKCELVITNLSTNIIFTRPENRTIGVSVTYLNSFQNDFLFFRAVWGFLTGIIFIILICAYSGLLAFAWYYECDPLNSKLAKAKDQILPLLVMDVFSEWQGLSGLFVAGVFSAALRLVHFREFKIFAHVLILA